MALSVVLWSAGTVAGAIQFFGVPPWIGFAVGGILLLLMVGAVLVLRFEFRRAVEVEPEAGDSRPPAWRADDLFDRQRFGGRLIKRGDRRVGQRRSPERRPLVRKE